MGKAIKDNLIFGIEFLYSNGKQDYNYNPTNNSHRKTERIGGGPFIRKYFILAKNFYAFGQSGLSYQHIDEHQTSYNGTTISTIYDGKGSEINLSLYPGISYSVTRKFFLDLALANLIAASYQDVKSTYNNSSQGINYTNTRSFGISTGLSGTTQFSIGARFIL